MKDMNMTKEINTIKPILNRLPHGNTLLFIPHADDEVFSMGGTLLKMKNNHERIDCVMMTDSALGGETSIRKQEAKKSCLALGIGFCTFLDIPDQGLALDNRIILKVLDILIEKNPTNIFFPSPLELHPDHRATAWIVWNALQAMGFKGEVYTYEVGNQSLANTFIDITDVMSQKLEVMNIYQSQLSQYDYVEIITAMNRSRSYTFSTNVMYVEAFFHFPDIASDLMSYFYDRKYIFQENFTTMAMPLISILIRTKDRKKLLKRALESIAKQSYQKLEVNIINDGGEDIESIVKSFSFLNIKIFTHLESKGRASSANVLLEMMEGQYAMFLDDDDTIDYHHIDTLVKILLKNPNILVAYSGVRSGDGLETKEDYNQAFDRALLRYQNYIPIHAVLFDTKLIAKGCRFDTQFDIYEDWDFWLQLSSHTSFYHSSTVSATYHIHGNSGAGESRVDRDRASWKLKVYEKWMPLWTASQFDQTCRALKTQKSQKFHISKEKSKEREEKLYKELLDDKNKIIELESKNKKLFASKSNSEAMIEALMRNRITLGDEDSLNTDRIFEVLSTRGNEAGCRELFEEVFQKEIDSSFWNWKYHGTSWRGICIQKDNKIIGHYNGMLRDVLYFGKREKAIQPCDSMVSKKERGGFKKGSPFYTMLSTWVNINLGVDKDFLLTYGFPNNRAMRLGDKLGFYTEVDKIEELKWSINALNEKNSSNIYIEKYHLKSNINTEINMLWKSMAKEFKKDIIGVRDANYLKRRYLLHPMNKYQIHLIKNDENILLGLFILRKTKKRMMLIDLIVPKAHFPLVIYEALKLTKKDGYEMLECWITASKSSLFECYDVEKYASNISIPTSKITPNFNPTEVKNKWFLMYGDTDFY